MKPRRAHTPLRAFGRKHVATPEQAALAAAALFIVYHVECERFDRGVCTGADALDGSGVMPANTTETGIISHHANAMGARLRERASSLGVPESALPAAESFVERMPYAQVEADYRAAVGLVGRLDA